MAAGPDQVPGPVEPNVAGDDDDKYLVLEDGSRLMKPPPPPGSKSASKASAATMPKEPPPVLPSILKTGWKPKAVALIVAIRLNLSDRLNALVQRYLECTCF